MVRGACCLLCVIALTPGAALAANTPLASFDAGATSFTAQPFATNLDNDPSEPGFGSARLSAGSAILNDPTLHAFDTFELQELVNPTGDLIGLNGGCDRGDTGCIQPVLRIGDSPVLFAMASDGSVANPFAVNDTSFAGAEPNQATLSSDIPSVVPEPGSLILLGTGVLGIAALPRFRKRG